MEAITPEDQKRINNCDDYLSTKRIMRSCEAYKEFEVGTAVHIKENFPNIERNSYVGAGYDNKASPHKFIIVQNDNGFLFAKRIIASGNPGVEITCLTIRYPSDVYEIEVDSDLLDSMLLDTEYDPTTAAKDLAKRKSKASRDNAKNRLMFDSAIGAYSYLNSLKIGDNLWDSFTTFGENITKYKVSNIERFVPDPNKNNQYQYRTYDSPHPHASAIKEGLQGITVTLEVEESEYRWARGTTINFYNICRKPQYKDHWSTFYTRKPFKPEDIA